MRNIVLALVVSTCAYAHGQACPTWPHQIQCNLDPKESCSGTYVPVGPESIQ